jgi:uncharacterized protein involved in outer membrane biogenesis
MSLQSHVKLVNADLAALMGGVTRVPATGRISVDAEVQGQGMSPASLVGSLKGSGLATLENVEIGGLDPTAMDAAITAVDRGVAINSARITEIANAGLDGGRLRLPFAAAPITIADGRVQLADLAAPAQSAYLGEARIPHGERAARLSVALRSGLLTILLCASCPQPGEAVAINRTLPSEEFFDRQHVAAARIFE